jgi:hypothetical protein
MLALQAELTWAWEAVAAVEVVHIIVVLVMGTSAQEIAPQFT